MTEFEAKKIYLRNLSGDYIAPIGYSAKFDMDGDEINVSELEADQTYDSTSPRAQSGLAVAEAISSTGINTEVSELGTSGTIALEDNKVYRITPNGSISLVLPEGDTPVEVEVEGDWTTPVQVGSNTWYGITYANDKFIAVGNNGYIANSTDGTTWTTPVQVGSNAWQSVTYANDKFIAVGNNGYIANSTDGTTWTLDRVGTYAWQSVTYVNGKFVAVGQSGYTTTSTDGTNWTTPVQVGTEFWRSVTYGNGKFVAVGDSGYTITSTDGITWSTPVQVSTSNWRSVTYGNGKFVAVGNYITTSTDGVTWTTPVHVPIASGTSIWFSVTYVNGKFVAVGNSGYITTSTDGTTWTTPIQVGTTWLSVTYGNGNFVAVGNNGYTSTKESGIRIIYILDPTKFHQMLVQVNMTTVQTIDVGTNMFFNHIQPDLSDVGVYNLLFEYDNNDNCWVCGLLSKSQAI